MEISRIPEPVAARVLADSLGWVERAAPGMTASSQVDRRQRIVGLLALGALVCSAVLAPIGTAVVLTSVATALYLVTLGHRVHLVRIALRGDASLDVSDDDARAVPDDELPIYTLLVPAYREPEVLADLIGALGRIEYPHDRLDVKLLLEADDDETIAAARALRSELPIEVLLVPEGPPRTKPRALNYGFAFARGELVAVYDAEDHPDPLQLRRAVLGFRRSAPEVACLQARLTFYGSSRNLLTRWFTAEYTTWFGLYLPGLAATRSPIPLGGTSNHFTAAVLHEVGCWDAHNVTEDCDLGIRLQRRGHRVAVLASTTMEEPNIDAINWVKQRSRWNKGYLQTWLVGMRDPVGMVRDLGLAGTAHFCLFVGCTPILAVLNLWFWALTAVWLMTRAALVQQLFPGVLYYLAVASFVLGNLVIVYLSVVGLRATRRVDLIGAALLSPIYWLLMAVASFRALVQLVTDPSHWEKTEHGLVGTPPPSRRATGST